MSTDAPKWWNEPLTRACVQAADQAWPNEVCGLITVPMTANRTDTNTQSGSVPHARESGDEVSRSLHVFDGEASPTFVAANPTAVIRFAYDLQRQNRTVIATFHSHPGGQMRFSSRDEMLFMWARDHVIAVKRKNTWTMMFTN